MSINPSIIVATIAGVIVFVVSRKVLQSTFLSNPAISACVGALVFIALLTHGQGLMEAILLPYKALGITVPLIFFLPLFFPKKNNHELKGPENKNSESIVQEDAE